MTEDSVALVLEARTSRYPVSVAPTPALTRGQTNLFLLTSCFLSPSLLYDALLQFYIFALFNNSTETISEE